MEIILNTALKTLARSTTLAVVALSSTIALHAQDRARLQERLGASTAVLHQIAGVPDKGIPVNIAHKARCVIVVPSFKKGAFLIGGEYGQGVATCYVAHKGWSSPAFIRMTGVSFGFQAGGQGTDLVLVGVTKESGNKLLSEKIKLGGDVAVAAGPVGRNSKAEASILANAGFLTYSRTKGIFAGVDLSGDEVNNNGKDTIAFYGKDLSHEEILNGAVPTPAAAKPFIREVTRVFGGSPR